MVRSMSSLATKALAGVSLLASPWAVAQAPVTTPQVTLGHVAVWAEDIEATSRFLTDVVGWRRHPMRFGIDSSDKTIGGIELANIDANGFWIELVSPTSPGAALDVLKQKGDGAIGELVVLSTDFDGLVKNMKQRGITLQNMDGTDRQGHEAVTLGIEHDGVRRPARLRVGYWPPEVSRGASVEVVEYSSGAPENVIAIRERTRSREPFPAGTPRLDRICIIVKDIDASARFYTDVLGFRRIPLEFGLDAATNAQSGGMKGAFIDTGSVWLALVQPVGPGPLMDYLEKKGDGHIAELIAEVDDLGAYYDAMKARGITLEDTRGEPLSETKKAHVLEPYGDRIAYFPTRVSHGMVIEVFQRGSTPASLIRQRDALQIR